MCIILTAWILWTYQDYGVAMQRSMHGREKKREHNNTVTNIALPVIVIVVNDANEITHQSSHPHKDTLKGEGLGGESWDSDIEMQVTCFQVDQI